MQRHLEAGVSAAQAARLALAETAAGDADQLQSAGLAPLANQLRTALDRLDEPGANAVLDRLLATFTLETVLRDVVLVMLVTPVHSRVARPLIEGLRNATVARDESLRELVPLRLTPFDDVARTAISARRGDDGATT